MGIIKILKLMKKWKIILLLMLV